MTGPTTAKLVTDYLALEGASDVDSELVPGAVDAVNDLVSTWRSPEPGGEWAPRYVRGATMLAARFVRRRSSPAGVEAFGEMGATYVNRWDHDIALLLGMGRHSRLAVG